MTNALLQISNMQVNYGAVEALKGISLHVSRQEIVCLIGANGAGKSTTLRAVSGLNRVSQGSVMFEDQDITNMRADKIVRSGISHCPEGRRVFGSLNVEENLRLGAFALRKLDKELMDWIYQLLPRLKERRKQLAGTLSGGEQQMLAIGRALMNKPKLLILDEPSLGLAPVLVKSIFKAIQEINQSGLSVLLVEQNAKMALKIANRGYVLELGKIVYHGRSEELLSSQAIQEAYLGKKH